MKTPETPAHVSVSLIQEPREEFAFVAKAVRAQGRRWTGQRRRVYGALVQAGDHVTAERLTSLLQGSEETVDTSTVYRTLEFFEEISLVEHVHVGHGSAQWKLRLPQGSHHHLHCERCGWTRPLSREEIGPFDQLLQVFGAARLSHHFALSCVCLQCAEKEETGSY